MTAPTPWSPRPLRPHRSGSEGRGGTKQCRHGDVHSSFQGGSEGRVRTGAGRDDLVVGVGVHAEADVGNQPLLLQQPQPGDEAVT